MAAEQRHPKPVPGLSIVLVLLTAGVISIGVKDAFHATAPPLVLPELRIDVNEATEAELTLLPGIGPRLAERIVQDRKVNGRFSSLSDLARVSRIGPATIERIEPYVLAPDAKDASAAP